MTASATESLSPAFHANRARGRLDLTVVAAGDVTRVQRWREEGSLRVRFPAHSPPLQAILLNNAGGIAGGDRFDLTVRLEENARLSVTSAAAEKIYRSLGPLAQIDVRIALARGAELVWLPHETILFDQSRLARSIEIDLEPDARLWFAESLVLGRSAMGEALNTGVLADRWRVRRGGRLVYADGVRLDGDIAATLAQKASAGGAAALATALIVPGNDDIVAAVRAREAEFRGEVGASAWNGVASLRLVARNGAALRHDLAIALAAAGCVLPRAWLN